MWLTTIANVGPKRPSQRHFETSSWIENSPPWVIAMFLLQSLLGNEVASTTTCFFVFRRVFPPLSRESIGRPFVREWLAISTLLCPFTSSFTEGWKSGLQLPSSFHIRHFSTYIFAEHLSSKSNKRPSKMACSQNGRWDNPRISHSSQCASFPLISLCLMDNTPSGPDFFRLWNELWTGRKIPVHRWRQRRSDGTPLYLRICSGGPLVEPLMARVQWGLLYSWVGLCVLVKRVDAGYKLALSFNKA